MENSATDAKLSALLDQWVENPTPSPDLLIGSRIREYTILECIGNGGTAKVYKARHDLLEQVRAIKLLHPELSTARESRVRFRFEARILSRLRSPHIVSVYEFGALERGVLFMVMEYLEGESIETRLQRIGSFSLSTAILVAQQVAKGLETAHRHGVIHRDVSPDNILLVPTGGGEKVKIIDFGIAKNLNTNSSGVTNPFNFVGKTEYCSPEQIVRKEGEQLDGRSDVYSFGVTLYEMLTGIRPFNATGIACAGKHLTEPPIPFEETNQGATIPTGVQNLVMRMLAKDRRNRPSSMGELLVELSRYR